MKISLNDHELGALFGLPHAVICLYVMAIRPRMNYATGTVGIKPFISWQALTEWVYVEPVPGVPIRQLSIEAVRRAAWRLRAAGLLRIASNVCNRQLIFECLLADRDSSVKNQADRRPTGQADMRRTRLGAGFTVQADRGLRTQADKHPGSGLLISPPVLAASLSIDESLRDPSPKPEKSKAVQQGKPARAAPMSTERIETLPPDIARHLKKVRKANGHDRDSKKSH